MLSFINYKQNPYGLKDIEYYLYLLVFVLSYLLLKEVFSRLPEVFSYFYPQLVAVIVGTLFFGIKFGFLNATLPPLLFFIFIGRDTSFLTIELAREFLIFILVWGRLKWLQNPSFWNLFTLIFIAETGGMLALFLLGGDPAILLKRLLFLLPGMAFGSMLSLGLMKTLWKIETELK